MDKMMNISALNLLAGAALSEDRINWNNVRSELENADISQPDKSVSAETSYVLPVLSAQEFASLCLILNSAYLGIPIEPGTNEVTALRSRVFKNSVPVGNMEVNNLKNKPFVLKLQTVPIIAEVTGTNQYL